MKVLESAQKWEKIKTLPSLKKKKRKKNPQKKQYDDMLKNKNILVFKMGE